MIYRVGSSGEPIEIHRTEVIEDNLNPQWQDLTLSVKELTKGDVNNAVLLIRCYDKDPGKSDDLIGTAQVLLDI